MLKRLSVIGRNDGSKLIISRPTTLKATTLNAKGSRSLVKPQTPPPVSTVRNQTANGISVSAATCISATTLSTANDSTTTLNATTANNTIISTKGSPATSHRPIQVRDFAWKSADDRHNGKGRHVNHSNRPKVYSGVPKADDELSTTEEEDGGDSGSDKENGENVNKMDEREVAAILGGVGNAVKRGLSSDTSGAFRIVNRNVRQRMMEADTMTMRKLARQGTFAE